MPNDTATEQRWLLDYQVEEKTGGRITASRLRKDRTAKQLFPFHKIGRNCYYDLTEIDARIEKARVGGKAPT